MPYTWKFLSLSPSTSKFSKLILENCDILYLRMKFWFYSPNKSRIKILRDIQNQQVNKTLLSFVEPSKLGQFCPFRHVIRILGLKAGSSIWENFRNQWPKSYNFECLNDCWMSFLCVSHSFRHARLIFSIDRASDPGIHHHFGHRIRDLRGEAFHLYKTHWITQFQNHASNLQYFFTKFLDIEIL